MLVYYTGSQKGKVQDKNSGCILRFEVTHLTAFLKLLKSVRVATGWKMIPLDNCEGIKRILIIVCSGEDMDVKFLRS